MHAAHSAVSDGTGSLLSSQKYWSSHGVHCAEQWLQASSGVLVQVGEAPLRSPWVGEQHSGGDSGGDGGCEAKAVKGALLESS